MHNSQGANLFIHQSNPLNELKEPQVSLYMAEKRTSNVENTELRLQLRGREWILVTIVALTFPLVLNI